MKKRVGIITINDFNNLGNRLQNYAVQEFLKKHNCDAITIKNSYEYNNKNKFLYFKLKDLAKKILKRKKKVTGREKFFDEFNNNIIFSSKYINPFVVDTESYDFFIVGSDQVWNPTFSRLSDVDLLSFAEPQKRISLSASFGIDNIDNCYIKKAKRELSKFKAISVREDRGKEIVEQITGREDVEVLLDPTMFLDAGEWDKVSKKTEQLKNEKYILNYFLGEISEERKKEIERVAAENNCEIINILDKSDPFYYTGPSEFLYLEKNAFLICTDSFHSCVFAILYNRPFVVFDRDDKNIKSMNSRLETLLNKFELLEQKCENNKISNKQLQVDYSKVQNILNDERNKADKFFEKNLL